MRKMKFWAAMALLIFAFMSGGCGGSAGSDDDDGESTLHAKVSSILTGRWTVSNYASASGTATIAADLRRFTNFNVVFSDIEFASDSDKSAGNANVYYSVSCSAYESGNYIGDLNISSVSSSSNFAQMVVNRGASDNQWIFTDSNGTRITVKFDSLSDGEDMAITISGTGTLTSDAGNRACVYTVTNNLTKTSSSTTINDDDASALHTTISSFLTGTWSFENADFDGTAASTRGDSIRLFSVKNFKLSISDIVFNDNTAESQASATVFYSYTSSARYENSTESLGDNFSIKSYSGSSSTVKTRGMTLSRISDEKWTLTSSSSGVPGITITRSNAREIEVVLTGTVNFSAINQDCTYTITTSMFKSSDTPTTDDSGDDSGGTESGIKEILEGTWLFAAGDVSTATATSNTLGTGRQFNLRLASNVYMTFENVTLTTGSDATSLTGTVIVTYDQKWTAYNQSGGVMQGSEGAFTISKNKEEMKLVKVSDSEWRIEDITDNNENVVITVDSSGNEISTVWNGTTDVLTLNVGGNDSTSYDDSYTYNITCSFRKQ